MNEPYRPPQETWPPAVYALTPPGLPYERDGDHLRLLSIFYYIWGAMTIAGSCFLLVDFFMGLAMLSHPSTWGTQPPRPFSPTQTGVTKLTGDMLVAIGGGGMVVGCTVGILTLCAGRCLAVQRHPLFITIMAALNCLSVPLGTVLGVFTFVVISRPTVKMLFATR